MKPRSPVLGYNHNVRYAGRLWHVQTEDSGVSNPHVFTHLFHEGTILATKRIDYDPTSDVGVVQKLMQAQHKAMLRDLKAGAFDDKITRFFGEPVTHAREDQTDPGAPISGEFDTAPKTDPSMSPPVPTKPSDRMPIVSPSRVAVPQQPPARTASSTVNPTAPTVSAPRQPGASPTRPNLTPSRPAIPVAASRSGTPSTTSQPRPPVSGIGGRRAPSSGAHAYGGGKPTAEGVVVARPAVIVGGDPHGTSPRATVGQRQRSFTPPPPPSQPPAREAPPPVQASKTPTSDNIFGGDLISEKSLDEVILAYLSEDLNEK
jgi:hypothetical protein